MCPPAAGRASACTSRWTCVGIDVADDDDEQSRPYHLRRPYCRRLDREIASIERSVPTRDRPYGLPAKAAAVREPLDEGIGVVVPLAHGGQILLPDDLDVGRVEPRRHQAIGHDAPRRVEGGGRGSHADDGPVELWLDDDRGAEARHRTAQHRARIAKRPALRHVEQERLDPRGLVRHLTRAAEQVDVGGHDVVGHDAAQDHGNAVDDEPRRVRDCARRCLHSPRRGAEERRYDGRSGARSESLNRLL